MKRSAFECLLVCLLVPALAPGCGGKVRQVFNVNLTKTGPVIVENTPTVFAQVADSLKMLGAAPDSIVKVSFGPEVPGSRKGALATQLRKAGFVSVVYDLALPGKPPEGG